MSFIPRNAFSPPTSLPRSYFLGHHRAGLTKMTSMLSSIDLILECRDYRVPLSSTNPLFESLLQGRKRIIVFTKRDLGCESPPSAQDRTRDALLARALQPSLALPTANTAPDTRRILNHIKDHATARNTLTGSRLLVVGMPNIGKSTLLNALRREGVHKGKAARTGAQPGITRAIASEVKILDADRGASLMSGDDGPMGSIASGGGGGGGVYLLDTPGVFVPFVPDPITMLKLTLVGCVKDGLVPTETLVDYLIYRLNLVDPSLYGHWCEPTNDVQVLLEAVAKKTGRLGKAGSLDTEAAGLWIVQRFRLGLLGRFVLDDVSEEEIEARRMAEAGISMTQAKKKGKEARRKKATAGGEPEM